MSASNFEELAEHIGHKIAVVPYGEPKSPSNSVSITSVCREDLKEHFSQEQIKKLDDFDMERLASKLADTYIENSFWIDLEILAKDILEEKEEQVKKVGAVV